QCLELDSTSEHVNHLQAGSKLRELKHVPWLKPLDASSRRWVHDYVVYPLYAGRVHASLGRGLSLQSLDLSFACPFIVNDTKNWTRLLSRDVRLHQLTEFGDLGGQPTSLSHGFG